MLPQAKQPYLLGCPSCKLRLALGFISTVFLRTSVISDPLSQGWIIRFVCNSPNQVLPDLITIPQICPYANREYLDQHIVSFHLPISGQNHITGTLMSLQPTPTPGSHCSSCFQLMNKYVIAQFFVTSPQPPSCAFDNSEFHSSSVISFHTNPLLFGLNLTA